MKFIGIDPGKRHMGLCILRKGAEPLLHEIAPKDSDLTGCIWALNSGLTKFLEENVEQDEQPTTYVIERQLSVGGESSSLMFAVMTHVLSVVLHPRFYRRKTDHVALPLPVQLRSFIKKKYGIDISSASATVRGFQELTKTKSRVSQHKVDAFFLAQMGQKLLEGTWQYKLPSKEAQLIPGVILNGVLHRPDQPSP